MELRQRKRIANQLPKFNEGETPFQIKPIQWQIPEDEYQTYQPKLSQQNIGNMITNPAQNPIQNPIQQQPAYQDGVLDTGEGGGLVFKQSTGGKISNVASGAAGIAGGVISQINSVKGVGEMMTEAGTTNRNIGGIGYQSQNYIDEGAEKSRVNAGGLSNTIGGVATGASAGASFGPIGAAVGAVVGGIAGLVGWGVSKSKLRKRLDNARQLTTRVNTGAQSGAMSTALQQDYYTQNGNTGGVLYANKGKDIL